MVLGPLYMKINIHTSICRATLSNDNSTPINDANSSWNKLPAILEVLSPRKRSLKACHIAAVFRFKLDHDGSPTRTITFTIIKFQFAWSLISNQTTSVFKPPVYLQAFFLSSQVGVNACHGDAMCSSTWAHQRLRDVHLNDPTINQGKVSTHPHHEEKNIWGDKIHKWIKSKWPWNGWTWYLPPYIVEKPPQE